MGNTASKQAYIKKMYPFLNDEDINSFMECHTWLQDEKDPSILESYVEDHFRGLAVRYNSIVETLEKMKNTEKQDLVPENETNIAENNNVNNNDNLSQGNQGKDENLMAHNNFEEFLNNLQSLHKELFELKNQRQQFFRIIQFLDNVINNLVRNIKDPSHRQIQLVDPQLKEDIFIIILNSLGFEITLYTESEILLTINNEPTADFLSIALDTIHSLYLQNPQFMNDVNSDPLVRERLQAQMNAPKERELDRAGFLASKHEQRLGQTYHPSSVNRVANGGYSLSSPPPQNNFSPASTNPNGGYSQGHNNQNNYPDPEQIKKKLYNTNSYLPDTDSVKGQIEDYRYKMRNNFLDDRKFSGKNMMTLSGLNERERQNDAMPKVNTAGFNSRVVTTKDIENKRIEEDKVKFGLRALELTNQFRASNKLPPLLWSQELCDVGMEHSIDMAKGKVPFGHHGFDKRCKKVKFYHSSMAENVAYNAGYSDPPKAAVEGWITSPGHRKNLLSKSNVCAISCYRAPNGAWYFTQLFAMRT